MENLHPVGIQNESIAEIYSNATGRKVGRLTTSTAVFQFRPIFFVLLHSLVFNVTSLRNIENNYEGLFDCGCAPLFATAFS